MQEVDMRLSPLLAAPLLAATAFAADELPKELRLSCDGKMNVVMDVPNPQSRSASFRLNLHLKDGAITDVQTGVVRASNACRSRVRSNVKRQGHTRSPTRPSGGTAQ